MSITEVAAEPARVNPAVNWLLAFQACNACNFTIGLGAPLIVTARHLGASEEQIGLLNALSPLMVGLQLLVTNWMVRLGYRRMMLMGWGTRSFMLLLIVPLPFLAGVLPQAFLSWAIIIPIFLFNVFRGLASGAWLPWLKTLLPEGERGRYLAREQITMNLSGFLTLIFCGAVLGRDPGALQFSLLFVVAWLAGMASVWFLRKAPEVMPGETEGECERSLRERLGAFSRIIRHRPFRAATRFTTVHTIAVSAIPGFLVIYVAEDLDWTTGAVMKLQSLTTVGVALTAIVWGALCERYGSRPVLRVALTGQLALLTFWIASASGLPVATLPALVIAFLCWGSLSAAQAISQTRLILDTSPPDDVTLSLPLYQVFVALAGGGAPLVWGMVLNRLRHPVGEGIPPDPTGAFSFAFLVFFGGCMMIGLIGHALLSSVRERSAFSTGRMLLNVAWDWPTRVVSPMLVKRRGGE